MVVRKYWCRFLYSKNIFCFSFSKYFQSDVRPCKYISSESSLAGKPLSLVKKTRLENNLTVGLAEKLWAEKFINEKIPEPYQSVRHILAHILGCNVGMLFDKHAKTLNEEESAKLEQMGLCRLARMPLQYIVGEWDFLDLTLKMMPPVFIPRPETESLVLLASKMLPEAENCLDIGCGSGAISLALLNRHSQLFCTAIDVDPFAIALTRANSEVLKLDDRISLINVSIQEAGISGREELTFDQKFDFIISNPPYVKTDLIHGLDSEILL